MSKYVGTGPSSYEKRIYRTAVSQRLRNTGLHRTTTQLSASTLHNQSCYYSEYHQITSLLFLSVPSSSQTFKTGPTGCTETAVPGYQFTLHNIPEEWRRHLYFSGSLRSSQNANTGMCHLTTGIRSEKCIVTWFHCRANTYLHKPR